MLMRLEQVYPSEILPLSLRQRGSSISTGVNWIINYVVVQITPPAISNIGWKFYIIFAVLNFLWLPIIYFFFPETKGLCQAPTGARAMDSPWPPSAYLVSSHPS